MEEPTSQGISHPPASTGRSPVRPDRPRLRRIVAPTLAQSSAQSRRTGPLPQPRVWSPASATQTKLVASEASETLSRSDSTRLRTLACAGKQPPRAQTRSVSMKEQPRPMARMGLGGDVGSHRPPPHGTPHDECAPVLQG